MSPRRSPARRFAVREGKVLRVAVGVMLNLIISTYAFHYIVLLRVTPTANRNSYRVAAAYWRPLPIPFPRGGSSFLLSLMWLCGSPSHLRRLGWGLLVGWGFSLAFSLLFIASVRVMK